MKKIVLTALPLLAVFVLAGCGNNGSQPQTNNNISTKSAGSNKATGADHTINQSDLVFFWGQGCPHCTNVDKFLEENKGLGEKIKLKKIEVFNDVSGQKLFLEKVKECGLSTAGVPVLYKDGKCTQGDQPIINELKKSL